MFSAHILDEDGDCIACGFIQAEGECPSNEQHQRAVMIAEILKKVEVRLLNKQTSELISVFMAS